MLGRQECTNAVHHLPASVRIIIGRATRKAGNFVVRTSYCSCLQDHEGERSSIVFPTENREEQWKSLSATHCEGWVLVWICERVKATMGRSCCGVEQGGGL